MKKFKKRDFYDLNKIFLCFVKYKAYTRNQTDRVKICLLLKWNKIKSVKTHRHQR